MWKSYKQQSADFSLKKLIFYSKSSKYVRFRHRIDLKPAKRVLRTILHLENSMRTKLKTQKNHGFFNFLMSGYSGNFTFSKEKSAGKVSLGVWVHIFSKVIVFYIFCKNLSWIWSYVKELQTKRWWFFHEKFTFEKCIQNLVKYMFFRKSWWKIKSSQNFFAGVRSFQQDTRVQIFTPNGANTQQLQLSM